MNRKYVPSHTPAAYFETYAPMPSPELEVAVTVGEALISINDVTSLVILTRGCWIKDLYSGKDTNET